MSDLDLRGLAHVASSSRSQRAMWPTTALMLSDLPRTVRGRPLASAGVCGGCYSFSYSPAQGRSNAGYQPDETRLRVDPESPVVALCTDPAPGSARASPFTCVMIL